MVDGERDECEALLVPWFKSHDFFKPTGEAQKRLP